MGKVETKTKDLYSLKEAKERLETEKKLQEENNSLKIKEFISLLNEASKKTGCKLGVDPSSPLNNLQIMITIE